MKKRLICLLVLLTLLVCACDSQEKKTIDQPFSVYFLNDTPDAQNGTLCAVTVSMNVNKMSIEQIVREYLAAQPPQGTHSAVPAGWILANVSMDERTVVVEFSGTKASELQSYLAAACMTKTLTQLEGVDAVHMRPAGETELISLSADDILLEDLSMQTQQESIVLYLPDDDKRYLLKHVQTVEAIETAEKPQYIIQHLLQLPSVDTCIPQGTKLLGISVDNGLCEINLSKEFVLGMEKRFAAERLAVYSIVNSLTELDEITTVDIWIEGAPLERLTFMKLPAGLERDESMVRSYDNTSDVDLYLSCDGQRLVAVPFQIDLREETELYQQVLSALIENDALYGASGYIPFDTKLLNMRMEGTACIVDLSGEFLTDCKSEQEEQLAVYSIVATLCNLEGISTVEILVEGLAPTYRNARLNLVRQPEATWYAER